MVVETGRAAVLHQLAEARERGETDHVLIKVFPDLIERPEPVEKLHILHFRQVAGKDLVEVVVSVDKAGIAEHVVRVDGLLRLLRKVVADRANEAVLSVEVNILVDCIVIVAGDERADISNEQSRHSKAPRNA